MTVKYIVSNITTTSIADVRDLYLELFDLDVVMDQRWIATHASGNEVTVQISIACEGGSGTAGPDLSIEVDDVDDIY
jgi:hypothetical protein